MARYVSNNRLYQIPPDVKIKSSVENSYLNRLDLSVELPKQMERVCPRCGSHNCVIKDSGRNRTVRHVPASNRSVFITFHQRRFRCKECGSSFYEPADWIHDRLHMTNTLVVDICLQLTDMVSIQSIAKKELIPDDVVLSVFVYVGKTFSLKSEKEYSSESIIIHLGLIVISFHEIAACQGRSRASGAKGTLYLLQFHGIQ